MLKSWRKPIRLLKEEHIGKTQCEGNLNLYEGTRKISGSDVGLEAPILGHVLMKCLIEPKVD